MAQNRKVAAVSLGFPVTYSSRWDANHIEYRLGQIQEIGAWCAKYNDSNQWIQVSSMEPQEWIGLQIQGRGKEYLKQRVTQFIVQYSNNGFDWFLADDGKLYNYTKSDNQIEEINFQQPFLARTLRICPKAWQDHISMRFEAFFQQSDQNTQKVKYN